MRNGQQVSERKGWRYWRIMVRAGFVSFPFFPIPNWEAKLNKAIADLRKLEREGK
jgi:hypothetical protein